ncbi:hypothetical protein LTR78_001475 [Recurvomyces mirabilis]|uniref:RNA helicase n=1 Tax=Recurvomyces mirabilis TaxID=574656 RepID=A0AAE1C5Q3_9PEZI|nr:hypothetical protein LTR78_001475 [Recurvomyces mirabilis]KAK5161454.1 hypothetical protein LTS14_001250 [Recurvomyces mirabilis]
MATGKATTLDIYARTYIPQILQSINDRPAQQLHSLPARWIDFQQYVHSFAGSAFLTADPLTPEIAEIQPVGGIQDLGPTNYHTVFRNALSTEAQALQQECIEHALYNVPLQLAERDPRPSMYWLRVPGLRELSLQVEIGDIVQLRQIHFGLRGEILEAPLLTYNAEGPVTIPHYVEQQNNAVVWAIDRLHERLVLRIDTLVRQSMKFNVCFTVQQGRLGALYRAVANVHHAMPNQDWLRSMLFPASEDGVMQKTLNKATIDWTMHDKLLNYEQIRAVDTALARNYGALPYIISGPPGTGKTKTMVEVALQLVERKDAHLLVCAPSDPAADTLTRRLRQSLEPKQLLRLNPPSRSFPEVPTAILPFCYIDDDIFSLPPPPQLMRYKIVVTTCRDAEILLRARLSNADLHSLEHGLLSALHPENSIPQQTLHWTSLLIDEAAQAIEPEACIPLLVVTPPYNYKPTKEQHLPSVIMAGDHNQLGPRTASKTHTLQTSLFERLLALTPYAAHPLTRSKQNNGIMPRLTKSLLPIPRAPFANLIRNYRSHPSILATPSSLFYADTLDPCALPTSTLTSWTGWRGRKWPVLFLSHSGKDEMEQDNGGWYNVSEARLALSTALSFLQQGLIEKADICIMSPFRAQVNLLRRLARTPEFGLRDVSIGPLEAFQGLESSLLILCTTRTRERFLEQDRLKGLGVVGEARRFNVAVTRAREGLVVIGSPRVLGKDECWGAFLGFCARNGLWDGGASERYMGGEGMVSRLERQLIHSGAVGLNDERDLIDGVRRLGVYDDEEQIRWREGVEMEEVVRGLGEEGDDEDDDGNDVDDGHEDEEDGEHEDHGDGHDDDYR